MFAHRELRLERDVAGLKLTENDGKRHQLAHICRRDELIRILLKQNQICVGIHQNRMLRLSLENCLRDWGRACGLNEQAGDEFQNGGCHRALGPSTKPRR